LEHFSEVLNRENPSNPTSEKEIELQDEIEEIDTFEPSRGEVRNRTSEEWKSAES